VVCKIFSKKILVGYFWQEKQLVSGLFTADKSTPRTFFNYFHKKIIFFRVFTDFSQYSLVESFQLFDLGFGNDFGKLLS